MYLRRMKDMNTTATTTTILYDRMNQDAKTGLASHLSRQNLRTVQKFTSECMLRLFESFMLQYAHMLAKKLSN